MGKLKVITNIKNRRGFIKFTRDLLIDNPPELQIMREVFSNFFPFATESEHLFYYNSSIKVYGYSPYFDELNEGDLIPEYQIEFKRNEIGEDKFDKMIKII